MLLLLVHECYSKERKVVRGWRWRCSKRWRERSSCWEFLVEGWRWQRLRGAVAAAGILGLKVAVVSFFSVFVSIPPLLLLRSPLSLFFFFLLPPLFSPVFFSAAFDSFSFHSSFLSKITCGFLPFVLPFLSKKKTIVSLSVSVFLPTLSLSLFFFLRPSSPVFSRFLLLLQKFLPPHSLRLSSSIYK
jgi:hypothetical protein